LLLERTLLSGNVYTGIFVDGRRDDAPELRSIATLDDVIVRDTRTDNLGEGGAAIELVAADFSMARVLVERNVGLGLYVHGTSTGSISDLVVRDTQPALFDTSGVGLVLRDGHGMILAGNAELGLERARLERNQTAGVMVSGRELLPGLTRVTTLRARDLEVLETGIDPYWKNGAGIALIGPGALELYRARVIRAQGAGILATNYLGFGNARALLEDIEVRDIRLGMAITGPNDAASIGVASIFGAEMTMRRFLVQKSEICGVQVIDASMDLYDGEVSGNPIGANVQSEELDVDRLARNVAYFDNGIDLDASKQSSPHVTAAILGDE
jgi:hypothetical protein